MLRHYTVRIHLYCSPYTSNCTIHAFGDTAIELDYFCSLFMDDILEMIIVQINLYALKMDISLANLPSTLIFLNIFGHKIMQL